ncbi:MAG: peptide chain release factor N(5)-glutamine methyltransferase [Chlamydiales bacterium]|nr:peptide chain release factor N(5)-glutamine methyltransferase [Chlamydiales bacterium]
MKTLGEILKLSYDYIRQKGSSHSRHEVEELIASTLGKKRLDLYLNFDKPLTEDELAKVRKNLKRLGDNEPLQYIEGTVQFYDCTLRVDKRVLIPRPETELLVDRIVKHIRLHPYTDKVLWDICTGSGCIGIAIKKALPELNVTLSDISEDALKVAEANAKENEVSVNIATGDLLEPFKGKKADFIVCNPPYISEEEYKGLDAHVVNFEPKLALVPGQTGLEAYSALINTLPAVCNPGAKIWLEIGHKQVY